jgi:hypothetical protein
MRRLCPISNSRFGRSLIRNSIRRHHRSNGRPFRRNNNGRRFLLSSSGRQHLRSQHGRRNHHRNGRSPRQIHIPVISHRHPTTIRDGCRPKTKTTKTPDALTVFITHV